MKSAGHSVRDFHPAPSRRSSRPAFRIFILAVVPALALACGRRHGREEDRPNLLLISVDTLRADRLGSYGYRRDTSPHIDGLAAEGVLFLNAFSASCKTTPSHMTILTGLFPRVHNVYMWKMGADGTFRGATLSGSIPTLAEILKGYGYSNVAFTGGANVAGRIGFDRGFDIYDENGDTGAACRWLEKNAGKQFFLFYHTYYTHDPYLPPPPYDTRYDPGYSGEIPSRREILERTGTREGEKWHGIWQAMHDMFWSKVNLDDPADRRHLSALYDGAIDYVDNELIRDLLGALKKTGTLDKTLIVFTSDHGEEFLEHGRLEHNSLYREVTRIPLIMRLPGRLPPARRVEELVRTV
ncbi:MAG TPA: sulfatase, partial [bacterium]|nr:sulfatase [bacterium]